MIVLAGNFLLTILSLVRKRLKVQLWDFRFILVTKCKILVLIHVSYLSKKVNILPIKKLSILILRPELEVLP